MKDISRQRKWQLKKQAEGKCVICGKKAEKTLCKEHSKKNNQLHKRWCDNNRQKIREYQRNWMREYRKKPIYLFSQDIKYKTFYEIWSKFPHGDIVPEMMIKGKPIWEMIRDKQLHVYIDSLQKDDPVIFASKLPKNRKILLLKSPSPTQ